MADKYTIRARRALGYALKEVREDARWSTEEMGQACNSSGAAISSWERAKSIPSGPKRAAIDAGCEWPPGTVQRFLDGEIHTRDEIFKKLKPKTVTPAWEIDPTSDAEPAKYTGSYLNPSVTERAEAAASLADLLRKAMTEPVQARLEHEIKVYIPQEWDEDDALRVLDAAQTLAQQAIDQYAKQRP